MVLFLKGERNEKITSGATEPPKPEEIEAHVEEAKNKLDELVKEIRKTGIKVKTHVHVGSPIEEIIPMAEEEDASLVAMSSHGKSLFRELLLGSTTCAVARRAKRPVLAMRT